MTIEVPRDRDGSFTPVIVKKRQRRLGPVDQIVLSLYGKGMTTGEISAHFAEIYGASVSKEVISNITDKVIQEQQSWSSRPLASHYVAVFVDAIRSSATSRSATARSRTARSTPRSASTCADIGTCWASGPAPREPASPPSSGSRS
jgi:transposase-like protein